MADSDISVLLIEIKENIKKIESGRYDERTLEWVWMLCSVLSAEYSVQTWTAKLRIYDNKTGRVAFTRDYSQKYDNVVWSPLFFVGLAGYTRNTYNFMQSWCLTALTDRAVADATAFLTSGK